MTSSTEDLPLTADFAPASYDDWRRLVDGVLKGAPFERLVGKTYDGLKIEPIYRRAHDTAPIAGRAAAAPWQIMQRIDHPDAAVANAQALHDLENGATGLTLVFASANGGYRSPAHRVNRGVSLHNWGTAADIYRVGDTYLNDEKSIVRYAGIAASLGAEVRVRSSKEGDDHLQVDLGYLTLVPRECSES